MFRDRVEAGRRLAEMLRRFEGRSDVVVLGVPRGGVVVAAEVARELHVPLDVIVVRKLGAPGNPEYAAGSVDENGNISVNPMAGVSEEYLRDQAVREVAEIRRRMERFRGGREAVPLAGKTAVLVDDGIATGQTMLAAVAAVRARQASLVVVATPVVAPDTARRLGEVADELVAVDIPRWFAAVGEFYDYFPQTEDAEVVAIMEATAPAAR